ncbi:MAG TPA: hypothetical protein VGC36_07415 [Rhizomicrobium sp.]
MPAQQPFKAFLKGIIVFLIGFGAFGAALAGSIDPGQPGPDPILAGSAPGPCAAAAAGADYVPGIDSTGNAVVPAEGADAGPGMGNGRVFVTIPQRHGRDVEVPVDLAQLARPTCNPAQHSPR